MLFNIEGDSKKVSQIEKVRFSSFLRFDKDDKFFVEDGLTTVHFEPAENLGDVQFVGEDPEDRVPLCGYFICHVPHKIDSTSFGYSYDVRVLCTREFLEKMYALALEKLRQEAKIDLLLNARIYKLPNNDFNYGVDVEKDFARALVSTHLSFGASSQKDS